MESDDDVMLDAMLELSTGDGETIAKEVLKFTKEDDDKADEDGVAELGLRANDVSCELAGG